jgi:hypothetical protein
MNSEQFSSTLHMVSRMLSPEVIFPSMMMDTNLVSEYTSVASIAQALLQISAESLQEVEPEIHPHMIQSKSCNIINNVIQNQ